MARILIFEAMQEISSFNPLPSGYESFNVQRGNALMGQRGENNAISQALNVFEAANIDVTPVYGARAGSAGILSAEGWARLSGEFLDAARAAVGGIDGIYVSLHGAMAAESELDPEGHLLTELRAMVGPDVPMVASLDLHGILTDRMIRALDAFAVYKTYPHVDFGDTGARAARLLVKCLEGKVRPVTARVVIPALVRGDELITKTGCYGDLLGETIRLERSGAALSAAVMIGNPFTDVPELCSQVLVTTDGDAAGAEAAALRLAAEFWPLRHRMQGKLVPVERAIAQAEAIDGPVVFTDAADATSSGATGDSNEILKALRASGTQKRVLAQIVDAEAAAAAHAAGVGAQIDVTLGGRSDPGRYTPMPVKATVRHLWDGRTRLETSGIPLDAGPTAVLTYDNVTVVAFTRTISLFDRAMYFASGLDPRDFDIIVVKSPHVEHHMYDAWVEKNFNVDAAGSTSADLKSLGHTICARPMYPLDADVVFTPQATLYGN